MTSRVALALFAAALALACGSGVVRVSGGATSTDHAPGSDVLATLALGPTGATVVADGSATELRAGAHVDGIALYQVLHRVELDWSDVDLASRPFGAVSALHEAAEQQTTALAARGLQPTVSSWSASGDGTSEREVTVVQGRNQSVIGETGSQTTRDHRSTLLRFDASRIVHWRLYVELGGGSSLAVRSEYDAARERLLVEATYADRTIDGAPYPTGSLTLQETLE